MEIEALAQIALDAVRRERALITTMVEFLATFDPGAIIEEYRRRMGLEYLTETDRRQAFLEYILAHSRKSAEERQL
jgi:hypothetical protein